jgi:16S rRNA (guanine527-N7)-methyltransferase
MSAAPRPAVTGAGGEEVRALLAEGLSTLAPDLPGTVTDRLLDYLALLLKWNRVYNLTAITDPLEAVRQHLLDALSILPWVDGRCLLDVGSGGGLPGIPIALARPELPVTLLDSIDKKTAFLRQAVAELHLRHVSVVRARVADWASAEPFGQIVSRAFASLAEFVGCTRHLLAADGRWLAMKGQRPDAEIAALPPGVEVVRCVPIQVPGLQAARHLVVLQAVGGR